MTVVTTPPPLSRPGAQLRLFDAIGTPADRKLRGGYYTPLTIARPMCQWAIRCATDRVLEPSAGDGNFLIAAAEALRAMGIKRDKLADHLTGIEIDATEARHASDRLAILIGSKSPAILTCADFFSWRQANPTRCFDAVVGNPPFIRYQTFPEPSRTRAMSLLASLGFRPNKLTNIWVPFVAGATASLAENGRLALVLPAELLQVSYAAQLRSFLVDNFRSIEMLTCNEMFFENAEQEVVILLADGKVCEASPSNQCSVDLRETGSLEELVSHRASTTRMSPASKMVKHDSEKWLKYFLSPLEITLMRSLRESGAVDVLARHAAVDVGVVTGENAFFVLTADQAREYGVEKHCRPLVGRSAHLRGTVFSTAEWRSLAQEGQRVYLLEIRAKDRLSSEALAYVARGERSGVHRGYKCSIRQPWYAVPAVWVPHSFLFRQIYDFPRMVLNEASAVSTDTIHRLTCSSDPRSLAENFFTYLTAASSEIEGRSYGGGVLELEPTEAERLLVPLKLENAVPLAEVDSLVRIGKLSDVLAENDRSVLIQGIGLSRRDCSMLKEIWQKMRNRRTSRRKSSRRPI